MKKNWKTKKLKEKHLNQRKNENLLAIFVVLASNVNCQTNVFVLSFLLFFIVFQYFKEMNPFESLKRVEF